MKVNVVNIKLPNTKFNGVEVEVATRFIKLSDVNNIINELLKEPTYQHEGEDFYSGVSAVEGEIACLDTYLLDKSIAAHWMTREHKNDFLWVECSNCGFLVENYKALKIGDGTNGPLGKIVGYNYHACPKCTAKMIMEG